MKSNKGIKSYPFTGYDSKIIKRIGDRIGILYSSDGSIDVYFGEKVVDEKIKGILCYFHFLAGQIRWFENHKSSDNIYSVNTYLDTVIMCINEFVSTYTKNNVSLNSDDILLGINQFEKKEYYKNLSCVIDLLMNDFYYLDIYGTSEGIHYDMLVDGNLSDIVDYVSDNEYGLGLRGYKIKRYAKANKDLCIQVSIY